MAENKYQEIEKKWQKYWEEHPELYRAENSKAQSLKPKKKYILVEFPYPSGSGLHVGHAFSFTGGDVYARYLRMKGDNVLFPMGWDAFGLPTENYAIKTGRKPQEVTGENTDRFRKQMKELAFSFDWSREVNTTDPDYYKWTQWIFIKLFEKGLAVKEEMPINWCPECKIGLANEEVVEGKCERCGAEVSRRNISQWIVKITKYAERLISGLEETDFIEKVKQAQINWIGKSEGARVKFKLSKDSTTILSSSRPRNIHSDDSGRKIGSSSIEELEVFTTRPDTLFGATFMVVAPEHELIEKIINSKSESLKNRIEEIKNYVKEAKRKSEMERVELTKEKTGVFSGLYAINPVNGKEIPIWVSDFVLASYGTGAIMSVPGHDQRDFDFAKKYNLPIIFVVEGQIQDLPAQKKVGVEPYEQAKGKLVNSGDWNGLEVPRDYEKILKWIEEKKIGKRAVSYHLRDWIFSRQHYWGEPIPMIFCDACAKNQRSQILNSKDLNKEEKEELLKNAGWQPVTEGDLPIVLPEVEAYQPTDDGKSPLSKIEDWVKTSCPKCGGRAVRETDTMPNWAGSDWYFLRYIDPKNETVLADVNGLKKWLPVDVYIGGDEHNTLHLLYSRFIYHFLHDLGAVPSKIREPYYKRLSHGVILGPDNQRMSKSRGNVVVPEIVSNKYGVDTLRMYLMFMGPFDGTIAWNEKTLMGVKRFLEKMERYLEANIKQLDNVNASSRNALVILNKMIRGVGSDYENYKFNTSVAKLMEGLNHLVTGGEWLAKKDLIKLIKIMAPLAPYFSEEWWSRLEADETISVHVSEWPEAEEKYLTEDVVKVVVAVNGKMRGVLEVDKEVSENKDKVLERALVDEKIKKWLEGKTIEKEIFVAGKMLNLVVLG